MGAGQREDVISDVACRSCAHFDADTGQCTVDGRDPIRQCVIAISEAFCSNVESGSRVLEVGPGSWSPLREGLPDTVDWVGVDVAENSVATQAGSVADLPFGDGAFDYVYSNQSMEHWHEFGTSLRLGLGEISRVLADGGETWLNAPVHLHGHPWFLQGRIDRVLELFEGPYWKIERVERWRKNHEPLPVYHGWRQTGFPDHVIPDAETASSWTVNFILRKRATQPRRRGDRLIAAIGEPLTPVLRDTPGVPSYGPVVNAFRLHDRPADAVEYLIDRARQKYRDS